jgi:heptosyltransferase I
MRIAIVKLSAIGDIIHSMVVLQFIKQKYPNSVIDWFVEDSLKGVLENNPHISNIQTIRFSEAKRKKSLVILINEITKLRKLKKYDFVIDIQNLIKSAVVARLIPSVRTIGLDKNSSRERLASIFYSEKYLIEHSMNVIKRNVTIISDSLKIQIRHDDIIKKSPFLFFNRFSFSGLISKKKPNILLIPGASFKSKIYPVSKYAQLSEKINANFIVVWGSSSEKKIAQQIKLLSPQVSITSKLSIDNLKALIASVDLIIGSDTGPTHMAWALNKPSITLFGPTPGYRNTYKTNINKVIESDSIVNPLNINKNDNSIKNIDVNEIIKTALTLIN